jgi:hypothetical protein
VSYHLSRLEPAHIHGVIEHMLHDCKFLPHSDGVSRENDLSREIVQDRETERVVVSYVSRSRKTAKTLLVYVMETWLIPSSI